MENISRKFHSHAYPVSRNEAIEMNLSVNKNQDTQLEGMMWGLWLDLEAELKERQPFSPIVELLTSSQATKLLSPVPQLKLPVNAPAPTLFQSTLPEMKQELTGPDVNVDPVDFEYVEAMIESARLVHRSITGGKILSCRTPDLTIHYNSVTTFKGWEQVTI